MKNTLPNKSGNSESFKKKVIRVGKLFNYSASSYRGFAIWLSNNEKYICVLFTASCNFLWRHPKLLDFQRIFFCILLKFVLRSTHSFPRGVLRKRCSENIQQMYRRTPMPKCDFNNFIEITTTLLKSHFGIGSNFIEIIVRHGCFSVNLLHIFRTPFYKNTSSAHYSFMT